MDLKVRSDAWNQFDLEKKYKMCTVFTIVNSLCFSLPVFQCVVTGRAHLQRE